MRQWTCGHDARCPTRRHNSDACGTRTDRVLPGRVAPNRTTRQKAPGLPKRLGSVMLDVFLRPMRVKPLSSCTFGRPEHRKSGTPGGIQLLLAAVRSAAAHQRHATGTASTKTAKDGVPVLPSSTSVPRAEPADAIFFSTVGSGAESSVGEEFPLSPWVFPDEGISVLSLLGFGGPGPDFDPQLQSITFAADDQQKA